MHLFQHFFSRKELSRYISYAIQKGAKVLAVENDTKPQPVASFAGRFGDLDHNERCFGPRKQYPNIARKGFTHKLYLLPKTKVTRFAGASMQLRQMKHIRTLTAIVAMM